MVSATSPRPMTVRTAKPRRPRRGRRRSGERSPRQARRQRGRDHCHPREPVSASRAPSLLKSIPREPSDAEELRGQQVGVEADNDTGHAPGEKRREVAVHVRPHDLLVAGQQYERHEGKGDAEGENDLAQDQCAGGVDPPGEQGPLRAEGRNGKATSGAAPARAERVSPTFPARGRSEVRGWPSARHAPPPVRSSVRRARQRGRPASWAPGSAGWRGCWPAPR